MSHFFLCWIDVLVSSALFFLSFCFFYFLMIRRPPRSTQGVSSAASDVYKRQVSTQSTWEQGGACQGALNLFDQFDDHGISLNGQIFNEQVVGFNFDIDVIAPAGNDVNRHRVFVFSHAGYLQ
eukprot:TRINITY_DN28999_c0_g1_i2.p2 TRINITY_DN28999_c0_g1~~TRINITY_DN28999_c0_g1_i2.p2  ORF type:complete len:123 (-),score=24.51 TRINITY_DN28999_c0_g1_i2:331-699(-)